MSRSFGDGQRLAPFLDFPIGTGGNHRPNMVYRLLGASVFVGDRAADCDWMADDALSVIYGPASGSWSLRRTTAGKPYAVRGDMRTDAISITRSDSITAIAVGAAGAIGLDAETVERVARHATTTDPWLSKQERAALSQTSPAERPIELACRWVLKEAYGKALGVGLGYDLGSVSFAVEHHRIVVQGSATSPFPGKCRFGLYWIDRHVFALAHADRVSGGDTIGTVGQEAACLPGGQGQRA